MFTISFLWLLRLGHQTLVKCPRMPRAEGFWCAPVETGSTLGGSLGRRNLRELDGLPFLGRIAVGLGFLGHFARPDLTVLVDRA